MRVLFTADLHLGRKIDFEDETLVLEILEKCRENNVSLVSIAGDVFDKPSPSVMTLLTFKKLYTNVDVIWCKGNHDINYDFQPCALDLFDNYQNEQFVKRDYSYNKFNIPKKKAKFLITHSPINGAMVNRHFVGDVGVFDLNFLEEMSEYYDYISLGDFHCRQDLTKNARYEGAPRQLNKGESGNPCLATIVDTLNMSQEVVEFTHNPRYQVIKGDSIPECVQKIEGLRLKRPHDHYTIRAQGKASRGNHQYCESLGVELEEEDMAMDRVHRSDLEMNVIKDPEQMIREYLKTLSIPIEESDLIKELREHLKGKDHG